MTQNTSQNRNTSAKFAIPGEAYAMLSAVLFGCMPLITRIAYRYGGNAYMASIGRYVTGSVWIAIMIYIFRKQGVPGMTLRVKKSELLTLFGLSLFSGSTSLLLYLSYNYIDSGLATTLHYSYPVLIMIFSALLFRKAIHRKEVLCLLLCVAGILFLYTPNGSIRPIGVLIALSSGFVYALFCVLFENSRVKALPALVSTFWFSAFSVFQIGIAALLTGNFIFNLPLQAHLAHIVLGLIASALGAVFYQRALQLCGSVRTSMLSTFEPVTSIIIGFFVFQEIISGRSFAGILCILAACIFLVKN